MKKSFKRFMAFVMVGVLCCSTVVSATGTTEETTSPATGNAVASGDVEGYVEKDVFVVELPTEVEESTFKFIMDPQGLINATSGDAYEGATFTDSTLYFETEENSYTDTSAAVTVKNKGTVAVDVKVTATVDAASLGAITMAEDATFTDETDTSLYLQLKKVSGDATDTVDSDVVDAEDGATISAQMAAVDESNYEVTYDAETGKYAYGLKDDADDSVFPTYSFALTGACNPNADWKDVADAEVAPSVELVWELTNAEDGPEDINLTKTSSTTALTATAAANITKVSWVKYNGASREGDLTVTTHYTKNGNKISIASAVVKSITAETILTLHLEDGTTQLLKITVQ